MMSDEKFESFLREFEPKKPRALPLRLFEKKRGPRYENWRRLSAAAAVILVCGASLWTGIRQARIAPVKNSEIAITLKLGKQPRHSAFELTRTALEDPSAFEAALELESRNSLPRFELP